MSSKDQQLPATKEKLFSNLIKCYEEKEYKKGIKVADSILKDYPTNAKTLCMKSLLVYLTTKDKVKGEQEIKLALRHDMKNAVCWQTLGLFYRHCKNYTEARKAFQFAYMYDPSNIQLLIDLTSLHAQNRDYAGFRTCNQKLIAQLSNRSGFWLGFMVGYFLEGKYDKCIEVIVEYRKTLDSTPSILRSQLILLESECLKAQGKVENAISTIKNNMGEILNEDAAKELLAVILDESRALWNELLHRNSENYRYYRGLECCLLNCFARYQSFTHLDLPSSSSSSTTTTHPLTEEQRKELRKMYMELQKTYPKSKAIQYIRLNLATVSKGEEEEEGFEELCEMMVKESIRKGIPSFFKSVKPLMMREKEKFDILISIVERYYQNLKSTNTLSGTSTTTNEEEEEPFVFLWLLLLRAQVEDARGHFSQALQLIEEAIQHTPTCYDVYLLQGRVLKHMGNLRESALAIGKASSLDRADRYMTNKHAKSLMRCNDVENADAIISYWTKKSTPARIDLANMQASWYETECARAYERRGDQVHANKLYTEVVENFDVYVQDQFDFHSYALRKSNIMDYVKFLHYTDRIYDHPYYRQSAAGLLRSAVYFYQHPFNKEEYLKHFQPVQLIGDIKQADEPDHDVDGFTLVSIPKPLQAALAIAERLVKVGLEDEECLDALMEWCGWMMKEGVEGKKVGEIVKKTMMAMMKGNALKAFAWLKYFKTVIGVDTRALEVKDIVGEATEQSAKETADYSLVRSVIALGELEGVEKMMEKMALLATCSINEYAALYSTVKRLGGTEHHLQVVMEKAKLHYPAFDVYVEFEKK